MDKRQARYVQQWMTQMDAEGREPPFYMLLDASRDPSIFPLMQNSFDDYRCLFLGKLSKAMQEVSPYLVRLTHESPTTDHIISKAWGKPWAIFMTSKLDLDSLRRHFRKFLMVKTSQHKTLFFRFFDPRIMRSFLPVCNDKEVKQILDPIQNMFLEDRTSEEIIRFKLDKKEKLQADHFELEKIFLESESV